MTLIGTPLFKDADSTIKYYTEQLDLTPNEVYRKVLDGEIQISRKAPKEWTGYWNSEGRFIREEK